MPAIPKRPRSKSSRASKELEESLKTIYGDDNLDLTTIERRRGSRLTSFLLRLVLFLFILTAVSWGGFLWWQTSGITGPNKPLEITIEIPETVVSGAATCFTVRYENIGQVPIASLSATLNLPQTFELSETKPAADENLNWTMSPLGSDSDGSIDICGIFHSEVPGTEKIQAVFTYRPANFNSEFQDIAGNIVTIDDSVLTLELAGPEEAVVGNTVTYIAKIKNINQNPVENLRLRPVFPETFSFSSSEPTVSEEGLIFWDTTSLGAGSEQSVEITGSFTASASGVLPIAVEVGFLDSDQNFVKQATATVDTNVLGGELSFQLIVNGSGKDQTSDLGDRLRGSLSYSNLGEETLEDLSFDLNLETTEKSLPINFENSDLAGGTRNNHTVTWKISDGLESNKEGVIDFYLDVPDHLDSQNADAVSLQINANINKVGSEATSRIISSSPITISFNSDAAISTEARYYDGEGIPLGSGPLPPQAGETTTYRIFWNLENSLHNLKNASITTTLPTGVSWIDNVQASIGSLTFNAVTKQIIWSISESSPGSSEAWFDLAITPEESDVGSFVKLINPTTFEATDSSTKDLVHGSTDALTTAVPNDDWAEGKGVVE